jgi:hypothetical protein
MANLTQVTLQLIVKKLDQILKLLKITTLGRRSTNREEEEKTLNENDIFSRPDNPEHEFMREDSGVHFNRTPEEPEKPEEPKTSAAQDKFNTAMHNVMKWVNKKE